MPVKRTVWLGGKEVPLAHPVNASKYTLHWWLENALEGCDRNRLNPYARNYIFGLLADLTAWWEDDLDPKFVNQLMRIRFKAT